jgi:hypothetical protein
MQTLGRVAAVSLAVTVTTVLPAASFAATSWHTVATFEGAKHQACKTLVDDGTQWRIKNRLVNGNRTRVGAGMTVQKNGVDTNRTWNSGLVRKGETSDVGSVTMPRNDDRFTLASFEYMGQAGNGGSLAITDIGRC